jgi:hypothetical protein
VREVYSLIAEEKKRREEEWSAEKGAGNLPALPGSRCHDTGSGNEKAASLTTMPRRAGGKECASLMSSEQTPARDNQTEEDEGMGKVIKFRRRRRVREEVCASEGSLRRMAKKYGYELVRPWTHPASDRNIPGHGPYILVPHHSGLSLAEVKEILARHKRHRQ